MILYYTESELFDYSSVYIPVYKILDSRKNYSQANAEDIYGTGSGKLIEFHKDHNNEVYSKLADFDFIHKGNSSSIMVWVLIEQVSEDAYVKLSGIKFKGYEGGYPLKIDTYQSSMAKKMYVYGGYCNSTVEYLISLAELTNMSNNQNMKNLFIARIISILGDAFRDSPRPELFNDILNHINHITAYHTNKAGSGATSDVLYRFLKAYNSYGDSLENAAMAPTDHTAIYENIELTINEIAHPSHGKDKVVLSSVKQG